MIREMLCVRDIVKVKNYRTLNDVSFMAYQGEVLGLTGSHGAGVSMLLDILLGRERCDSGTIYVDGQKVAFGSVADANRAGVFRVGRTSLLVTDLSIAENVCLTYPRVTQGPFVSRRQIEQRAREILATYGVQTDVRRKAYELSEYEKNAIEVIKTAMHHAKVLILDNVMLNYNAGQRTKMKRLIARLAAFGITVIIVSTEAESIIDVADRMIVMTDGRVEGSFVRREYDVTAINMVMTPQRVRPLLKMDVAQAGNEVLRLCGVSTGGVDFPDAVICGGEGVGLLDGHNRIDKTLIHVLRGMQAYTGEIRICGCPSNIRSSRDAMNCAIAYLTRYDAPEMLLENLSILDNLLLLDPATYARFGFINRRLQRFAGREFMKNVGLPVELAELQPRDLNAHLRNEVNLIKLRAMKPRIVLLDDPFLDADAAMKARIYDFVIEMTTAGACVIVGVTDEIERETLVTRPMLRV